MKVTILGASGGVGQQLMQQALTHGHSVTAVVRESSHLQPTQSVRVLRGDLTSEAFLREAVRGQDAVLSALGCRLKGLGFWNTPEVPDFLPRNAKALAAAMKAENIRRLVAVSSGGVGDSANAVPAFFRFFVKVTAMRVVFDELNAMEQVFLASGLSVCLVRPPGLTDGPLTGKAVGVPGFQGRATISRADVADFMLREAAKSSSELKTPLIGVSSID